MAQVVLQCRRHLGKGVIEPRRNKHRIVAEAICPSGFLRDISFDRTFNGIDQFSMTSQGKHTTKARATRWSWENGCQFAQQLLQFPVLCVVAGITSRENSGRATERMNFQTRIVRDHEATKVSRRIDRFRDCVFRKRLALFSWDSNVRMRVRSVTLNSSPNNCANSRVLCALVVASSKSIRSSNRIANFCFFPAFLIPIPMSSERRKPYPFDRIDPKWQSIWEARRAFHAPNPDEENFDPAKPKFYVLDMFPYPSGAGLHVGHPEGYTATDIVARYKRLRGFNVLHPMGWDAFGLPAEQYAIKTGQHPAITTRENIAKFKSQLKQIGFSYDWEREINTTDPRYLQMDAVDLSSRSTIPGSIPRQTRPSQLRPIAGAIQIAFGSLMSRRFQSTGVQSLERFWPMRK